MSELFKKIMIQAFKNRMNEGKTMEEIRKCYPKLTVGEFNEIKKEVERVEENSG